MALVGVSSPGYRSLALGYLRAYAEADPRLGGVSFTTVELDTSVDPWWIAYRVLALEPDVVAFSVVCWNARIVYEAARIISAALPGATIVVGGPEVGPIAENVLAHNPAIDVVVRGEGEATFAELLTLVARGRNIQRVAGTSVREGERIVSAPDRPLISDLDTIPSPYLSGVVQPADGTAYIESYRGCPHSCGYCYEGKGYSRIRQFSSERISAEIEHVAQSPGVRSFSFIDPVFNLTPDRLDWLSATLAPYARKGIRLHTIEVDLERVGAAEARLLAAAGVVSVETGPQSIGRAALKASCRHFDAEAFERGVAACHAEGISVECDLIIGLPGDTSEDVVAGIEFAIGMDPGKVQLSTLHVLPGTDFWERADELGLVFDPEPPHEVIRTAEMPYADLRRLEVLGNAAANLYGARLAQSSGLPPEPKGYAS